MPAHSPEELHAQLATAFNTGDVDAYADLYEDDATLVVPPEGRRVRGKDEIRAASEPIFALAPRARMDVLGKVQGDGLALTHGRWHIVGTLDGERVEMSGRGTMVSRRRPDGTWRIALDNAMTPD
jgi:uncharacterized protein (TIGR02246 family)